MEPPGQTFNKPVDVYLTHSAAEQDPSADYYDVTVQQLEQEWEDLETHHISKREDLPSEIVSKHPDIHEYLPVVKASILNTCTLVVTTRIKSENITLVPGKSYVYSRIYGSENKLQISFPAGCVDKECLLNIKVFPADELLDDNGTIDMKTVFFPVIEVSGQHKPFLQPVEVELTYSHHSLAEIDANLPTVGHIKRFTSRDGVLLQTQKDSLGKPTCTNIADEAETMIQRMKEDQVKIIYSVTHFCRHLLGLFMVGSDPRECEKLAYPPPKVSNFRAYFWAVLYVDTPILEVYIAPPHLKIEVKSKLGLLTECLSQHTIKPGTHVFFCVKVDSTHLGIEDYKCVFCEDGCTSMPNRVNSSTVVTLQFVHFWKKRCKNPGHSKVQRNVLLGKVTISKKRNSQEHSRRNSLRSVPQAANYVPPTSDEQTYRPEQPVMMREEAVLQLSTDQVDASSKDAPKATGTNNAVEGDTTAVAKMSADEVDASGATAKSNLPPPPDFKPVELRDINPSDIEWHEATKDPIDVLLTVVNDYEFCAAYGNLGKPVTSDSRQNLGRVYFGEIGNNKVALLRSSQGAGGKIGMQATCLAAIKELRPKAIICLGVCFGMDKSKHKLGDVLVSAKLGTYGPSCMSNNGLEVSRGVVTECNARLSRLFNDGKIGWNSPRNDVLQPTIHCGLVLSGPQLIDNNDRKIALKDRYPEAIGGEMEGEGLYNICEPSKIPWIVCKAVSDWADGTKDKKWQPFSAAVSASLVQHVLTRNYIPESEHAYKNRIDTGDEVDAGGNRAKRRRAEDENETSKESTKAKRPKKLRIGEINGLLHEKLCTKLNIKNKGKDYIALAGVMGYTRDEIASFQLGTDPADALLTNWGVECGNDVSRLYEHLRKIGRKDLVDMLEESSS